MVEIMALAGYTLLALVALVFIVAWMGDNL